MRRLNYDDVAHLYDEPLRDHDVDQNLLAFLASNDTISLESLHVLDVGCGTGKQLAADHTHAPDARLVGLDRSGAMLRIAQKRCPALKLIQGDGADLPFASESFHYATSQFSYHHIGRTPSLVLELLRVLEPGGRFVMTNIDPWSMPGWLVYRYFPEARELDDRHFLPTTEFAALMRDAGFDGVQVWLKDLSRDEDLRDFLAYASARHRASQFTAISDDSYAAGLRRLENTLAGAGGNDVVVRSEFIQVTIVGDKPLNTRGTASTW